MNPKVEFLQQQGTGSCGSGGRVGHLVRGLWFDVQLLLGQDTEPQTVCEEQVCTMKGICHQCVYVFECCIAKLFKWPTDERSTV